MVSSFPIPTVQMEKMLLLLLAVNQAAARFVVFPFFWKNVSNPRDHASGGEEKPSRAKPSINDSECTWKSVIHWEEREACSSRGAKSSTGKNGALLCCLMEEVCDFFLLFHVPMPLRKVLAVWIFSPTLVGLLVADVGLMWWNFPPSRLSYVFS